MQPETTPTPSLAPSPDHRKNLIHDLILYALSFAAVTGLGIGLVAAVVGVIATWL